MPRSTLRTPIIQSSLRCWTEGEVDCGRVSFTGFLILHSSLIGSQNNTAVRSFLGKGGISFLCKPSFKAQCAGCSGGDCTCQEGSKEVSLRKRRRGRLTRKTKLYRLSQSLCFSSSPNVYELLPGDPINFCDPSVHYSCHLVHDKGQEL